MNDNVVYKIIDFYGIIIHLLLLLILSIVLFSLRDAPDSISKRIIYFLTFYNLIGVIYYAIQYYKLNNRPL